MRRSDYYAAISGVLSKEAALPIMHFSDADSIEEKTDPSAFLDLADVFPRMDSSRIEVLLATLSKRDAKFLAVMSVYYSDAVLEDGSNEHKTVESHEWWKELITRYFPSSSVVRSYQESDVAIANFAISDRAKGQIRRLQPAPLAKELVRLADRFSLTARLYSGGTTSQKQVLDDLAGKSVAVVGNARSLALSSHGREIDSHDIVVRFNRVPIVSRRSHGYKTDWVATGVPLGDERMQQLGATRLLWMSSFRRKMNRPTIRIHDLYLHPPAEIAALARGIGVERPSTGVTTVDLLKRSACRSISLYGFDFYASQSSSSHQSIETAPHAFDLEAKYIRGLAASDQRFSIM